MARSTAWSILLASFAVVPPACGFHAVIGHSATEHQAQAPELGLGPSPDRDQALVLDGVPTPKEVRRAIRSAHHANPPEVVSESCKTLKGRAFDDPDKDWMRRAGGVEAAILAIKHVRGHRAVVLECAKALAMMAMYNNESSTAAGNLGAVELVCDIMKGSPDDPEMQLGAVSASLMDLNAENRARWAAAGGIQLNIDSIRRHYNSSEAVLQGAYAFAAGTQTPNELPFVEAGGIEVLIALMRDHRSSPRVREEAMQATRPLVRHSAALRERLVEASYVPWLVAAMRDAPLDKYQQQVACNNLKYLTFFNSTHRDLVVQAGATVAAWQAVRDFWKMQNDDSHPRYAHQLYPVMEDCMELLKFLTWSSEGREQLRHTTWETRLPPLLEQYKSQRVQVSGHAVMKAMRMG